MFLRSVKKVVAAVFLTALFVSVSTGFIYAEDSNMGTVTAGILNLREAPNTSSKVLDRLTKGNQLKVIGNSDGWYKVSVNGKDGWVSGEYISKIKSVSQESKTAKPGTITGNDVNVRKGPGLKYDVITRFNKGERLDILEASDSWYRIKTSGGIEGWVSSTYISVDINGKSDETVVIAKAPDPGITGGQKNTGKADSAADAAITDNPDKPDESAEKAEKFEDKVSRGGGSLTSRIIDYARSLLGVKYTYGGSSPETGFDCSGFTKYVFNEFGIVLNRISADQAAQGTEVQLEELLPGDLMFWDTDGGTVNISHVGIYIGQGKFINAVSSSGGKIVISEVNDKYWTARYMTARRVIGVELENSK